MKPTDKEKRDCEWEPEEDSKHSRRSDGLDELIYKHHKYGRCSRCYGTAEGLTKDGKCTSCGWEDK